MAYSHTPASEHVPLVLTGLISGLILLSETVRSYRPLVLFILVLVLVLVLGLVCDQYWGLFHSTAVYVLTQHLHFLSELVCDQATIYKFCFFSFLF